MKILLIDNYDRFTYNLYHYFSSLKCKVEVLRNDKIVIPRSNFIFLKDDKVVFLAKKDSISVVENIFRISSI